MQIWFSVLEMRSRMAGKAAAASSSAASARAASKAEAVPPSNRRVKILEAFGERVRRAAGNSQLLIQFAQVKICRGNFTEQA